MTEHLNVVDLQVEMSSGYKSEFRERSELEIKIFGDHWHIKLNDWVRPAEEGVLIEM